MTTAATAMNNYHKWFEDSLQSLGHYDPSIVRKALLCSSDEKEGDVAFQQIALWLEDRVIRLWDVEARQKLRTDFWSCLPNYLDQLECPLDYYSATANEDWRMNNHNRARTMYWLISSAVSETHGDSCHPITSTITAAEASTTAADSMSANHFPLGFTTDDPKVDQVLTYTRMQHLLKLRQEQDQINDCIARLQNTSVAKSKPLKSRKR